MAVGDASVSLIVGTANRIGFERIERMRKRRHVSDGGSGGQFILSLLVLWRGVKVGLTGSISCVR